VSSAVLANGEVHARGLHSQDGRDPKLNRLNLSLVNFINNLKVVPTNNVNLTSFRLLIDHYANLSVRRGIADLYVEAVTKDGFIKIWYNPHRGHSAIGYRSPIDYENTYRQNTWSRTLHRPLRRGNSTLQVDLCQLAQPG
jgi:hypothetical protein